MEGGGGGAIGTADELALRERPGALGANSRRAGGSGSTRAGEGACGALPTVWGTAWDTTFWRLRKTMKEQQLRAMVVHPLPEPQ